MHRRPSSGVNEPSNEEEAGVIVSKRNQLHGRQVGRVSKGETFTVDCVAIYANREGIAA